MQSPTADPEAPAPVAPVAAVRAFHAQLATLGEDLDDRGRIDLIRALEELKSAAAAAQARVSVDFDASQRAAQAAAGVPADRQGRGIAGQIALARRESPHRGGRRLGAARAWTTEMPHTLAALETGRLTEWRAELLVRETALLSAEHRAEVDREVCGDPSRLDGLGDTKVVADALVERVTGQDTADAVPVAVHLVLTDTTLFGTGNEPADLHGHGPVPPGRARDLLRTAIQRLGAEGAGWLRRVYTDPVTGDLTAMDTRTRRFCEGLDLLIAVRDAGICRTPYCDAPIRDTDHVIPYDQGGHTNAANGQGLCQACNLAKQAPHWTARPRPGPRHTVTTTTPTGHTYHSTAPPMPGTIRNPYPLDLVWAA
ncbi:MAG TPA: HNH endonuclease signature motif containing protein [Actinophytocola sp.]|nr:HNH endonuclease signature motif containing protein [Actinophytocola sp.]